MTFLTSMLDLIPPYRKHRLEQLAEEASATATLGEAINKWNAYALELTEKEKVEGVIPRRIRRDLAHKIREYIATEKSLDEMAKYRSLPLEEVVHLKKIGDDALALSLAKLTSTAIHYHSDKKAWDGLSSAQRQEELQKYNSFAQQVSPLTSQLLELQHQLQTISGQYLSLLLQRVSTAMEQNGQLEKNLSPQERLRYDFHLKLNYGLRYSSLLEEAKDFYHMLENSVPFLEESTAALQGMEQRVKKYLEVYSPKAAEAVKFMVESVAKNLAPLCVSSPSNYQIDDAKRAVRGELAEIRKICAFYHQAEPEKLKELDEVAKVTK